jgi:hypothetical protein
MIKPGDVYIEKLMAPNMMAPNMRPEEYPPRVVILSANESYVQYNYVPRFNTDCSEDGYDNGWRTDLFLENYQLDETHMVELLLNEYESTTRRDLD